ncbi:hypothetical protein AOC36_04840 [Erysipelothrix larvae]|uniref:Ribosomal protein eL8/eL30/eS12/Gadd45 domain-containing protein n=1 Tax=Erysipelothrix larvae TaxID=1514105 RepID=A0A0X8GZJ0_9FIRM|nr:ribosomal L7Ae/L30e/S12e/Gadd45 family protein [Erysipelothrix larvae]AMC93324.1 hypothetical protein AOC36_04840 [Erysipelothrix larvae]
MNSLNDIQISKVQRNLGLCQRASKCIFGDKLVDSLSSGNVKLVMLATDASDRTKSMFNKKCAFYNIPVIELLSVDELSISIGKTNRVALGIIDAGFTRMIQKTIYGKGEVINESKEKEQTRKRERKSIPE